MNLDGDAARAARQEVEAEPKTMTLGGKTYELPNELPIRFATNAAKGEWEAAMTALLNGKAQQFLDDASDKDIVQWLLPELTKLYAGTSEGESSASGTSSKRGSKSSRRPSSASTKSA
jgi:hypothetical protein